MKSKTTLYFLIIIAISILLAWILFTPPGLLGKADAIGYAVCHRIAARTFKIIDRPIAMCARCTGQYLGAVIAILYAGLRGRRRAGWPNKKVLALLGIFVGAYGVDGVNSYLHLYPNLGQFYLYEPNNILRLLTGTGMGLVIGLVVWIMLQSVVWEKVEDEPVLSGFWQWAWLPLLALGVDGLVLTENPLVLYPLTLISALGVVGLLTILYALIWIILFRVENTFNRLRDLMWPLLAGFSMAMLQILILDFLRYWATGNWDGFNL